MVNFYKIQVSVINNSNVEITALGLSIAIRWWRSYQRKLDRKFACLDKLQFTYLLVKLRVGDNGQIPVICASIDNINNNAAEDRIR
jgi:hypothetical protein